MYDISVVSCFAVLIEVLYEFKIEGNVRAVPGTITIKPLRLVDIRIRFGHHDSGDSAILKFESIQQFSPLISHIESLILVLSVDVLEIARFIVITIWIVNRFVRKSSIAKHFLKKTNNNVNAETSHALLKPVSEHIFHLLNQSWIAIIDVGLLVVKLMEIELLSNGRISPSTVAEETQPIIGWYEEICIGID
jgi:hypothetical protein